jgi:hypothetical protein
VRRRVGRQVWLTFTLTLALTFAPLLVVVAAWTGGGVLLRRRLQEGEEIAAGDGQQPEYGDEQ